MIMGLRTSLFEFSLANPLYVGATVNAWEVDINGVKTSTRADLFAGPTGTDQLANPQILDGDGKFAEPVYHEDPIILEISGPNVASHETGAIFPRGTWRGTWTTATVYYPGDFINDGVNGTATNNIYMIVGMHTSGTWATDVADATKMVLVIDYVTLSALVVPDAAVGVKGKTGFATRAEINADDADEAMIPSEFLGSKFDPNGKHCIPIMAGALQAATTNGAAGGAVESTTNQILYRTFDFSNTTQEFCGFVLPVFKSWNESTITARFRWTCASGGTPGEGVTWALQAVAVSNDDAIDTAWGTEQIINDILLALGDMHLTSETPAITVGGAPAEADTIFFRVKRNVADAGDNMAGDARLIGIDLFLTTNTGTDA